MYIRLDDPCPLRPLVLEGREGGFTWKAVERESKILTEMCYIMMDFNHILNMKFVLSFVFLE